MAATTTLQRLKILSYHSITPDARGGKWRLPVARFRAQMEYLVAHAIPVLPLVEAVRQLADGIHPPRAVALTFDDGYLDNHTHAMPVLQSLHLPATLFVLGRGTWRDRAQAPGEEQPRMGCAHMREWREAGLEIGVHGLCHVELPALEEAQLEAELVTAREVIAERLRQAPSPVFAYPYGLHTARVRHAVRAAGYACAVDGSSPRACTANTDLFSLHRETVYGDAPLWAFAAKVSPRWDTPRLLWFVPARRVAGVARRLLASALVNAVAPPTCESGP